MRLGVEELSSSSGQHEIDFISAVSELHGIGSAELSKLISDSDNNIIRTFTESGSHVEIDMEKLARYLPLHLMAKVILSRRDEELLKYLLCGIRLLHSLCDLAPRHPKLEQILLDDVKVSEQLLDLIFYLLAFLTNFKQEHKNFNNLPLLHSALVASSLYLLTGCISSQWQDISCVLIAHRKVDVFLDAAFEAVRLDINFLQLKLSGQCTDFPIADSNPEGTLYYMCQQCEGSMQFLQSMCQQKSFRERFVKNKELSVKGGVLLLTKAVLDMSINAIYGEFSSVVASVSRLKSRSLAILLHLCEAESTSYLDDVVSTSESMNMAKSVASEVLLLMKNMVANSNKLTNPSERCSPTGLLQLNALRLADILSDDSNFRSFIIAHFTEVLAAMLAVPHTEFLPSWCSSELSPMEEDANLEYDLFLAAGCVLDSVSSADPIPMMNCRFSLITRDMPRASYAHQRTSFLVKIVANLHCFVPEICNEEEDRFVNNFLECLKGVMPKLPAPGVGEAGIISTNLCSLLSFAESLTPRFLNEDDVQLLRVFVTRCQSLIASDDHEVNQVEEAQSSRKCSPSPTNEVSHDHTNRDGDLKEHTSENLGFQDIQFNIKTYNMEEVREIIGGIQNTETSGSDSSSSRGKNSIDSKVNVGFPSSSQHLGFIEAERSGTVVQVEKLRRKRKRSVMNDKQVSLIEMALVKEPDMQRNAASILSWAEHLSSHGSEVTTSQLKNWLNNRKARLARAAKDSRPLSEGETPYTDKHSGTGIGSHYDSSESPADDRTSGERIPQITPIRKGTVLLPEYINIASAGFVQCGPSAHVLLIDWHGDEIGKGKVFQVQGKWFGFNLDESEMCVVDILELRVDGRNKLPYVSPYEATCTTFDEAKSKFGVIRVLWDTKKMITVPPQ